MIGKNKILLVEDDLDLGGLLKFFLEKEGFKVYWDKTGAKSKEIVKNETSHKLTNS